jgi:hypothetical protein
MAKELFGMARPDKGDTFSTLNAKLADLKQSNFASFLDWLYVAVEKLKSDRENFYRSLRNRNSWWINASRWTLGILAAAALLATAVAAMAALAGTEGTPLENWQSRGLFCAFAIYSVMGAIALFERGTDLSASYFRHLTITIAIRNLWNEFQLTMLKEYPSLLTTASKDEPAARNRAIELARALCKDIDTLVTAEQTEWRTEFFESLKELDAVAKEGLGKVRTDLETAMEKVTNAAKEAKAAAEQAKAALLPADVNVTVTGDFDGNLVVLVDQAKRHDKPVMKKFSIRGITPGLHEFEVKTKKGTQEIHLSEVVELKAGLQSYAVVLP